jgi:hypothetical protein
MRAALIRLFVRRMLAPEAADTADATSRLTTLVAAAGGPGLVVAATGWFRLVINLLMRDPDPDAYARAVTGDRMLLVALALCTSGLATAYLLDSLFPDQLDHENLGPLPLRSRDVLGARLVALFVPALLVTASAAVPPGLLHAFAMASGGAPEGFWRHLPSIVAALAAASFTAFLVVAGAGSLLILVPRALARMLTAPLQAILVAVSVLLPFTFASRTTSAPFVALHAALLGHATHADLARVRSAGLVALAGALALLAGFTASARRYATGDFGAEATAWTATHGLFSRVTSFLLALVGRTGPERQALRLIIPTLARSARHRRTVVIFAAGGTALAFAGLTFVEEGPAELLPFGLVAALHIASFAMLVGFRTSFGTPLPAQPLETLRSMGGGDVDPPTLVLRALVAIVVVPLTLLAGLGVGTTRGTAEGVGLAGAYALFGTAYAWMFASGFRRTPFAPGALVVDAPGPMLGIAGLLFGVYVGILPAVVSSYGVPLAPFWLAAGVAAMAFALFHRGEEPVGGVEDGEVSMRLAE